MPDLPDLVAPEREMLASWLDFHRDTLLAKCEGLDSDQLAARSVPPSTLSLLGLVRHMSEVERHWFIRVLLGERVENRYSTLDDRDGDFNGAAPANAAEGLANFQVDCERARQIAADAGPLETLAAGEWRGNTVSLRWIMTHMVEEYARATTAMPIFFASVSTELLAKGLPQDTSRGESYATAA